MRIGSFGDQHTADVRENCGMVSRPRHVPSKQKTKGPLWRVSYYFEPKLSMTLNDLTMDG